MAEVAIPKPYVGISGVAHYEQHTALFNIALRERLDNLGHFMMIGVQATTKTQVLEVENRRGRMWHPVGESIADAAASEDSGLTKPFVHCAFIKEPDLAQGITNVMRRTRHYNRGIQFNGLPWVSQDYRPFLHNFHETYPDQLTVIQANGRTLNSHSPTEVAQELTTMPVDYLLLDPSGGVGIEFDPKTIKPYIDEVYQRHIPAGVVVAGGLESENVEQLFGPLKEIYPGLSCDAEGRLRKGPEGVTELDLQAAEDFVLAWKNTL